MPRLLATLCCLASAAAGAQPALSDLPLRTLAASCAACHGTDGQAVAGTAMVALSGRQRDDISAQLRAFKSGSRSGTVMPQIAKGYDDAQIDALAAYFAQVRAARP